MESGEAFETYDQWKLAAPDDEDGIDRAFDDDDVPDQDDDEVCGQFYDGQ